MIRHRSTVRPVLPKVCIALPLRYITNRLLVATLAGYSELLELYVILTNQIVPLLSTTFERWSRDINVDKVFQAQLPSYILC